MQISKIKALVQSLIKSIEQEDYAKLRELYHHDVENYITNADGEIFLVNGCENYIKLLQKMNFSSVKPSLNITQINVLSENEVLFMLEVKAQKPHQSLHNFAAYVLTLENEKIKKTTMVEALPKDSDAFWNAP